jgi:uncharacterized protein YceK
MQEPKVMSRSLTGLLPAVILLSGCSTIQIHSDQAVTPAPYVGTKQALNKTKRYWYDYDLYGQVVVAALDVPLCMVADTLVLPYDAYRSGHRYDEPAQIGPPLPPPGPSPSW